MSEVFLVDGLRTPIGKTKGILKELLPEKLAAYLLTSLLRRQNLVAKQIEGVYLGNVVGPGGNIARLSVLEAGWDFSVPAFTLDSQCGSGLTAINLAQSTIASGQADLIIAGGLESTSLAPRRQFHQNDPRFTDFETYYEQAPFSPAWVGNPEVGKGAENLARLLNISRLEMDEQAMLSHQRAVKAVHAGDLAEIIQPLAVQGKTLTQDEGPKAKMNRQLLQRMPGAFAKDGLVTAGNSCLKHDGAALVLLASAKAVKKYRLEIRAKIFPGVAVGYDPNLFPLSPVPAITKLLKQNKLSLADLEAIEINEAFAVKILACCQKLKISPGQVNLLGGAIAYGHPYGASGAIILLHLLQALKKQQGRYGIAAIGAVGGLGSATLLERLT